MRLCAAARLAAGLDEVHRIDLSSEPQNGL
jgi:hypothetical protein